jgi:hypothetical protein
MGSAKIESSRNGGAWEWIWRSLVQTGGTSHVS